MRRSLRRATLTLVVAAVLLALASPAVAASREEPAPAASLARPHALAELQAWLGQWLDLSPIQSLSAPGGHSADPDGEPALSANPDDGGGTATTEGGHSADPNG
jgi:hypothetical protein